MINSMDGDIEKNSRRRGSLQFGFQASGYELKNREMLINSFWLGMKYLRKGEKTRIEKYILKQLKWLAQLKRR